MTDSKPDWASYDPDKPFFQSERESNKRWSRLRCASLSWELPARRSSDPLVALIDAEDDARGDQFLADNEAQVDRLRGGGLSRDVKRRLTRHLLDALERARLFGGWMSALLRERGTRTRTWKRSVR